ncbi:MAG: tRNA lysidine(34) synthetase TilS, partial [Anaeroplasmataceae bacterium]|nr:tRNA lysidine(34) synthetase TilS [Anaeroplasmataceae bacterium]
IPQNNEKYLKLWYNDLKLPFFIRNKKEGDFINMSYGNKKVARILIDKKIPLSKRDQIPLVFDRDGNLLWIYDLAKSQAVHNQKDKSDIFLVCEEVAYEK